MRPYDLSTYEPLDRPVFRSPGGAWESAAVFAVVTVALLASPRSAPAAPSTFHTASHALVFIAGLLAVATTVLSAVRTVILPRATPTRFGRVTGSLVGVTFRLLSGRTPSYERRDAVYALFGPMQLMSLLVSWLLTVYLGAALMFWALDDGTWRRSLTLSGSSLFTLGFEVPHAGPQTGLTFVEASIGLVLLALLITYLPSLYASFSRREQAVSRLEVRAGSPPSGTEMLWRAYTIGSGEEVLTATFAAWEDWFVDIEETHSTFPTLVFFRSPTPDHSWVTSAGAVLDAAALRASSIVEPRSAEAQLVIRAGRLTLSRLAAFQGVRMPDEVAYGDPVTISRSEYDEALDRIAESGAPVVEDRDRGYADFAGWRVNYDVALVALAALTYAPYAPWSSDRSLPRRHHRPGWAKRLHPHGSGRV